MRLNELETSPYFSIVFGQKTENDHKHIEQAAKQLAEEKIIELYECEYTNDGIYIKGRLI